MSALFDEIKGLLSAAPPNVYLLDRNLTGEVLVLADKWVWLAISRPEFNQQREEYRVLEWGNERLDDLQNAHFFGSKWEMKTWLCDRFVDMKVPE